MEILKDDYFNHVYVEMWNKYVENVPYQIKYNLKFIKYKN